MKPDPAVCNNDNGSQCGLGILTLDGSGSFCCQSSSGCPWLLKCVKVCSIRIESFRISLGLSPVTTPEPRGYPSCSVPLITHATISSPLLPRPGEPVRVVLSQPFAQAEGYPPKFAY